MLLDIGNELVKKAIELGATEAEAFLISGKITSLSFSKYVEDFRSSLTTGVGLRAVVGKRVGLHSTSTLDDVKSIAERAVAIAKSSPEDPHWVSLPKRLERRAVEGTYDGRLVKMEPEELVEVVSIVSNSVANVSEKVEPVRSLLYAIAGKVAICNSYGEEVEREGTIVTMWLTAKAEEAGRKATKTEHKEARTWADVDFEKLAMDAAEGALKSLEAKPIKSAKMPVVISNDLFASLLSIMLSGPFSADWVQEGRSPLANKVGSEIASNEITIVDDGTMSYGFGSKEFDDEGIATQRTTLIDKGVLVNFLYDTYTAQREGKRSTGNAWRWYWTIPLPRPSNLVFQQGEAKVEEVIEETKSGLYVVETIGHWLSNPISGNLNATVTHGYLIENGELAQPVKGVVLSGDFYAVLKDGIDIIADDIRNTSNSYAPTVRVKELTIAGL